MTASSATSMAAWTHGRQTVSAILWPGRLLSGVPAPFPAVCAFRLLQQQRHAPTTAFFVTSKAIRAATGLPSRWPVQMQHRCTRTPRTPRRRCPSSARNRAALAQVQRFLPHAVRNHCRLTPAHSAHSAQAHRKKHAANQSVLTHGVCCFGVCRTVQSSTVAPQTRVSRLRCAMMTLLLGLDSGATSARRVSSATVRCARTSTTASATRARSMGCARTWGPTRTAVSVGTDMCSATE